MEMKVKILLVQNAVKIGDKKANIEAVDRLVTPYENSGIDLVVLPELWNVGWECKLFPKMAESEDDSVTLKFLSDLAKRLNANVAGGSYVRKLSNGEIKNSCPVFNRNGELIAMYDKMHLYTHMGADEGKYATVGTHLFMPRCDIGKLGLSICYDIRFPEVFRHYTRNGADILINMAAWPESKREPWMILQRARAIENQSFMVAVSQAGVLADGSKNIGSSMVISPDGTVLDSLGTEEGVLETTIDLYQMYKLRKDIPTLLDIQDKYEFSEE